MVPPSPSPSHARALVLLAVLPALVLASIQAFWPWPFFSDDAFISLRYAERLLAGEGLTWTAGEAVEGYSNLLWVLSCAGLGALGLDLVTAARLLGALCTAGALWLLASAGRPNDARSTLLAAGAPLLTAASAPVMAWTLGGLEGPMVLLWLAWGGVAVVRLHDGATSMRHLVFCGLPFALLCLSRPDGPLWAAATGIALALPALHGGIAVAGRRALGFGALPLVAFAGQLVFRLAYYGDVVPNTAHVKLGLSTAAFAAGAEYMAQGLWVVQGLTWCSLLGCIVLLYQRSTRTVALSLLLPTLAWLLYLTVIGGDHFGGYRLMHGVQAPMALLMALGVRQFATTWPRAVLALLLMLVGTAANVALSRTDPLSAYVRSETWEWQGKVLGETFARAFGPRAPLLAVDAAGALPYYSKLPALDMLGLTDRTIATTQTPEWAAQAAAAGGLVRSQGHLRGNGAHVMDRLPDLIMFSPPPGMPLPVFLSGLELEYDRRFLDGYRCVVLEMPPVEWMAGVTARIQAPFWVRIEGKAGVVRSAERIDVPAFLLGAYRQPIPIQCRYERPTGTPEAVARDMAQAEAWQWFTAERFVAAVPDPDGAMRLELRANKQARLDIAVPEGTWRIALLPTGTGLDARLEGASADGGTFTVAAAATTALVVTAPAGVQLPVRLATVTLHRIR